MKHLFARLVAVFALAVAVAVFFAGCGEAKPAAESYKKLHWSVDALMKYRNDENVNHLVLVQYTGDSKARVLVYEKENVSRKGFEDAGVWNEVLNCDGLVGRDQIGNADIDSARTPAGDFEITTAFGIKENPGTKLPYVTVTNDTYCCGDEGEQFNKIIDINDCPHECTGEHLIEYSPNYNYGFFFDYNKEQVREKGFAFFFHCMDAKPYTGGCISVSEENMKTILEMLDPGSRILISDLK